MKDKSPIQTLRGEHMVARKAVYILESLAKDLRKKESVSLLRAKELMEAIRAAMESHHQKEMDVFPHLVENEKLMKKDLLGALAEEHELGYEYLSNALRIIDYKNKAAKEKYELLPFHLEKYTELLKAHIKKEEAGFFPLVKNCILEDSQNALSKSFKKTSKKFQDQKTRELIVEAATRR